MRNLLCIVSLLGLTTSIAHAGAPSRAVVKRDLAATLNSYNASKGNPPLSHAAQRMLVRTIHQTADKAQVIKGVQEKASVKDRTNFMLERAIEASVVGNWKGTRGSLEQGKLSVRDMSKSKAFFMRALNGLPPAK